MKTLIYLLAMTCSMSIMAQQNVDIETIPSSSNPKCLAITVTSLEVHDINLLVQSYRFYYDNEKLDMSEVILAPEIQQGHLKTQVNVLNREMSKEINGGIAFEKDMMFTSVNLIPSSDSEDIISLSYMDKIQVADVCFDKEVNTTDLVLATPKNTLQYGKVFSTIYYTTDQTAAPAEKEMLSFNLIIED